RAVFSVILLNNGIDPELDVDWLPLEDNEQEQALRDGRIHALVRLDPPLYVTQKNNPDLVEIASNQTGPMAGLVCYVAAAGEHLWRDNPLAASALVLALNEASEYAQQHPDEAARIFAANSKFSLEDVEGSQRGLDFHSHHHQISSLRENVSLYVRDFQKVGSLPADLDIDEFVARSYVDIKTHS